MNFQITIPGIVSNDFLDHGIYDFSMAVGYIQNLPYGRNTDRADYTLVLREQKGTCSTKHALLAALAQEQQQNDIKLILAIYKMTEENTAGVGKHLSEHNLSYLPEAHCYLRIAGTNTDLTTSVSRFDRISNAIIEEEEIKPADIGDYKINRHKLFISKWMSDAAISCSDEDIWLIREKCIRSLGHQND